MRYSLAARAQPQPVVPGSETVSYTHLDVYKRQGDDPFNEIAPRDSFRHVFANVEVCLVCHAESPLNRCGRFRRS